MSKAELNLLNSAFSEFTRASESLISYYSSLETQIKQLKQEIQEKNDQLERAKVYLYELLDSLPVGVVVLEDGGTFQFSNKNARRFKSAELVDALRRSGNDFGEVKNGRECFRWRRQALADGFSGVEVIVFEDVTEIEKMKERLERDERLRAMGEMAARIAHEIKNPLGSMELFLSMLLNSRLRKGEKQYVDYVLFGVNAIDRVINNILSYTRPKTLVSQSARLSELVRDTVRFMGVSIEMRGLTIHVETLYDEPSVFDPDLMKLVLMNLLSNAMDALPEGGSVKVIIREDGDYVVLLVSDNGVGMSEEVRKNLFDPFFTTKDKGVGLGLFIVYNIVKAHGGYIEVEAEVGKGSTIFIYLPKKRL